MSPLPERPVLGFIGLGNIGGGVCANLVADGHQVWIFDVDETRTRPLAGSGAKVGASVQEVGSQADLTLLSLPTPEIMKSVTEQWLEAASGSGKVLVDLTTNSPSTIRTVGARMSERGTRLLEAPVTGGAPGARNRQLLFIVGGDEDLVAEVKPLLETIGRGVYHLGPLGCGNVGKLVNSLIAFTSMWVSLEGLALGAKNGIDLRLLLEMLRSAGAANSYLEKRVEQISERGRPAEFAMALAAKDAGLMLEAGLESGVPMPVASAIQMMLSYAKAQGLGGLDISDLVEVVERAAAVKLELRPPDAP